MAHHPVTVAAPRSLVQPGRVGAAPSPPYIVQREEDDFVGAVLGELVTDAGRARLAATRAVERGPDGVLKLFMPLQRRTHLALVETWCDTVGRPRLDPARIEAAGTVLRRVRPGGGPVRYDGWMRAEGVVKGWLPLDRVGGADADPSPEVRRAQRDTGVPSLDRALRERAAGRDWAVLEETVTGMFAAPPDVCASEGRTLHYGIVTTASSERADAEPDVAAIFADFGPDAGNDAFAKHLASPLRGFGFTFPRPSGGRLTPAWLEDAQRRAQPFDPERPGAASAETLFVLLLRQLTQEFDAFGDAPASRDIRRRLDDIELPYPAEPGDPPGHSVRASTFLEQASRMLQGVRTASVRMPERWPALGPAQAKLLQRSLSASMRERFKAVRGRPGRFDEPDARYVLRTFVRLKAEEGCPPRTVWSGTSEPFRIAPWYEAAGDPVLISMPDLTKLDRVKAMKPNVAFSLPRDLQALVEGDPKSLLDGERKDGSSLGIGWICSLSIPIITFCAFIVLFIFLSLFNLFFQWLMFIKICIPYPKAQE